MRRLKEKKQLIFAEFSSPNANGALISRTSPADFPELAPDIDPFVPMLPADDCEWSHGLIMDIIEHRIVFIILANCYPTDEDKQQHLNLHMKKLEEMFLGVAMFHQKWTWPKREGMGHVDASTMAPPGNAMPYIPSKTNKESQCAGIWNTFSKTLGKLDMSRSPLNDRTKRLSVFCFLEDGRSGTRQDDKHMLPHILNKPGRWRNDEDNLSKKHAAWKDIILPWPWGGEWEYELNRVTSTRSQNTA